jgi:3D (Asp-Asp-Asp) domain-containing protein
MRREKRCVRKKSMGVLRVIGVIVGFGFLIHINHRECAQFADKSPVREKASAGANITSKPNADASDKFHATAYCLTGITSSGVEAAPGLVAADPKVIPLGSMIYVDSPFMGGIYQVLDTGSHVKGKIIDIFIPSLERCKEFGRRIVKVKVLRYGFHGDPSEKPPNK